MSAAADPGDSEPAPRPALRPAPLAGLRIIAVEQYGAGPFGSLYLADLGAEIIKIEDPSVGGDVSRYIPPGASGTDSLFFEAFNRSKRSVALDLKHPDGRAVFERLVASADAVYSNLRGDQPERLGLRYTRSYANFVWVDLGRDCRPVFTELLKRGVIVRTGDIFGAPTHIRVTTGTPEQNQRFVDALEGVLRA